MFHKTEDRLQKVLTKNICDFVFLHAVTEKGNMTVAEPSEMEEFTWDILFQEFYTICQPIFTNFCTHEMFHKQILKLKKTIFPKKTYHLYIRDDDIYKKL